MSTFCFLNASFRPDSRSFCKGFGQFISVGTTTSTVGRIADSPIADFSFAAGDSGSGRTQRDLKTRESLQQTLVTPTSCASAIALVGGKVMPGDE
jgi:hypothetical protein